MGIEDIQISEELETNAPSIKYSGNEGPKSPQEMEQMIMASLEEEYAKYVFEMEEQGIQPMSLRQFMDQAMAEGQMSGGNPLPQDPTKPVNPFQPKPTGPVLPDRQMAAYGGIMGLDGRRQYGIGSSLKKFVRKVIPNEVADIAVKAAPFVAMIPGQQGTAALMRGLGRFDQTGSMSDAFKQGALTYGFGKVASPLTSKIPGIGTDYSGLEGIMQFGRDAGSSLQGGYNALKTKLAPARGYENADELLKGKTLLGSPREAGKLKSIATQLPSPEPGFIEKVVSSIGDLMPKSKLGQALVGGGALALGTKLLGGGPQEVESAIMERGEGLDIDGIRAEVTEAFKDETGEKLLALRNKYPYLGTQASKDIANMAMGGRIGKAEGGIMDLGGMEKDYRAEGGFVPIGREEKADDVPARLSVNEFVFTADAVRNAGGGDIDKGAEVMENMMKYLEQGGQVSEESQGIQGLRAGGRAGFANGLGVDTDQIKKDLGMLKQFTPGGMLGNLAKAGAKKISDVELETLIKVIAKATPGGMIAKKVTEVLIDRYGMSPEEAQMKIVNKLGMDANEGFKNPSGTSDDGYNIVGIESSAEDYYPEKNRLSKFREQIQDLPRVPTPMPNPGERMPDKYYPEGPGSFPERGERMPMPYPYPSPDRDPGIFMDRDPDNRRRLQELFNTSQRLSEVSG